MKIKIIVSHILLIGIASAQVITWTPYFAKDSDSITVIFDATRGNGGLMGYTGDVYAHTGVITNLSTQPSDWKYVKTNWGVNTPETKLERIGTNLYRYKIISSPRNFYGVPVSEQLLKVAFVFRSGVQVGGRWLEGKTESGGDIFLPLSSPGLNVSIINPSEDFLFKELNDTLNINVASVNSVSLSLFVDNSLVSQTTGSNLDYDIIVNESGKKWIKAVAVDSFGTFKADSFYYVVKTPVIFQDLPIGIVDGINYTSGTSATLSLYAPYKKFIYVIGSFNNWEVDPNYSMKMTPDSTRYWLELSGLIPGQEATFQYLIDGTMKIADPYSEKVLDPWNDQYISSATYPGLIPYPSGKTTEIVSVIQTDQIPYPWRVTNFQRPAKTDLVIYELLLRDFLSTHSYKTLHDTLSYLKTLGVNAIELMPINEFEGNESWGYNPSFHLAVDKYYGPKDELKRFIDKAHEMGIAVILDVVLNHAFGQSPLVRLYWDAVNQRPAANSPWFNQIAKHDYNVGYDFNHESQATKDYVDRVTEFWMTEYKVDGFRFDLSKGFTQKNTLGNVRLWGQYDQTRIDIWKHIANKIWAIDSTFYVILEHFADDNEEVVLSNYGMMLWGNHNCNYNQATMGYPSGPCGTWDFSRIYYANRSGWSKSNLVGYMESHDEERLMFKNITYGNSSDAYNIKNIEAGFERVKLAATFFFTIPGPKMIWQFGELGYDVSIDSDCRVCNKPILWNYYSDSKRLKLYKVFAELIKLKKNYEVFRTGDYITSLSDSTKKINITHSSMDVTIIGNFHVIPISVTAAFSKTGKWYDFFSGDSIDVSEVNMLIDLAPGQFRIYTTVKLPTPEPGLVTGVENEFSETVPTSYQLYQNYPNPFNPTTKITYAIPTPPSSSPLVKGRSDAGFVSLKVYDILGNVVSTLVNEVKQPGVYEFELNANKLTSGVYFYQLKVGSFIETKKMILLR